MPINPIHKLMSCTSFVNIIVVFFLTSFCFCLGSAQVPFTNEGQVFLVFENTNNLVEMDINPSNSSIIFSEINPILGTEVNAMGFRRTDNLLYALHPTDHTLLRIDATGNVETLANLSLGNGQAFLAGDVTPDGKFLMAFGSTNNVDVSLVKIDLEDPNYGVSTFNLIGGSLHLRDVAFDPTESFAYGYDELSKSIVRIDADNLSFTILLPIEDFNEFYGVYFDAFGDLFAYGSTISGVADAIFIVDKSDGDETTVTTGGVLPTADMASCPYTVAIKNKVNSSLTFPCSEIEYTLTIANQSDQELTGVTLEQPLPTGFNLVDVTQNPIGGMLDNAAAPEIFRLTNTTIPIGNHVLKVLVEIDDIPEGDYNSQAELLNLPTNLGGSRLSDNPITVKRDDPTKVQIIRVDEDSIFFSNLLCAGDELVLDASIYGTNITWQDNTTEPTFTVTQPGLYYYLASSGCQSLYVEHDVTVATCPFTIELGLSIFPDVTLPCSEVIYTYYLDNDSGDDRLGVGLTDTLAEGFTILDVLYNETGGDLKPDLAPNVFCMDGITLKSGIDSINVLVEVGDVTPKLYSHQAILYNLPPEIGIFRLSDNPATQIIDSTRLEVLGTNTDSLFLTEYLCIGEELVLDVTAFGVDYLWFDGSTSGTYTVMAPGLYDLVLFNGCEPTYVFFTVLEAPAIEISVEEDRYFITQSDSVFLELAIQNASDSLLLEWNDPLDTSLNCLNCLVTSARPFFDVAYGIKASNDFCSDSLTIFVEVDRTRRIYAPNVFSPNGDGFNDIFYLQTPDFGILKTLRIFDRWGSLIYETNEAQMNSPINGWDGGWSGQFRYDGMFIWQAEIEFIDQSVEAFGGDIGILR